MELKKIYLFFMQLKSDKCVFFGKINDIHIIINEKQKVKSQDCS